LKTGNYGCRSALYQRASFRTAKLGEQAAPFRSSGEQFGSHEVNFAGIEELKISFRKMPMLNETA
jgi:hypothetical protein